MKPQGKIIEAKGWKRHINISLDKYEVVSQAILATLGNEPMKFGELRAKIEKKIKDFPGSIGWYAVSVLRQLETEGKIKRTGSSYYKK